MPGRDARLGDGRPPGPAGEADRPGGGWSTHEAPAKLTLTLRVTGVRADGYHLLDAEMQSVDLCDTVEIGPGEGVEVRGPTGSGVPVGEDNLVQRALRLVGRRAAVRLTKRIPPGGGLGGGSSDAAAVLRWAGFEDLEAAVRLGGDVPFCLRGGRARVRGVGEVVHSLPGPAADEVFTLLIPPFAVSTVEVYRRWDALGGPVGDGPNDLEPAALAVEARLAAWRDRLGEATGVTPVLAGSGATWWVPGAYPGDGRVVVRALPPAVREEGESR